MWWWCRVEREAIPGRRKRRRQLNKKLPLISRRCRDNRSTTTSKNLTFSCSQFPLIHIRRQTLGRSNSDTSLRSARSYVSMERCARPPPRFSQVFQPSDFKHELPRRCGSFPHSSPTAPCHSPDPIPPPLPRRSIASTASTVEMRKPSNNSIYRRQPSRISDDETENHYNFII